MKEIEKLIASFACRTPDSATTCIDTAITLCVTQRKPAYLEICVNLPIQPLPSAFAFPIPLRIPLFNPANLTLVSEAIEMFISLWRRSMNPIVLVGPVPRRISALPGLLKLLPQLGCPIAIQPHAKGSVPESTEWRFAGTYLGPVSSTPFLQQLVESQSDLVVVFGGQWSDYSNAGNSAKLPTDRMIQINAGFVKFPDGREVWVPFGEFVEALIAAGLDSKEAVWKTFVDTGVETHMVDKDTSVAGEMANAGGRLVKRVEFVRELQSQLDAQNSIPTTVFLEIGNSQFDGGYLKLPMGGSVEMQLQYGAIGWATPAAIGSAFACSESDDAVPKRRTVLLVGDGALQVTAQALSIAVAHSFTAHLDLIILVENNMGYTIEDVLHQANYNSIPNWEYSKLLDLFGAREVGKEGKRKTRAWKVESEDEMKAAMSEAFAEGAIGVRLIEVRMGREDAAEALRMW